MLIALSLNIGAYADKAGQRLGYTYNQQVFNGIVSFAMSRPEVKLRPISSAFSGSNELGDVDGLIGRGGKEDLRDRLNGAPIMNVASAPADGTYQVCCDNEAIARMAIDHLFDSNLRNFAVIHSLASGLSTQRKNAFSNVCMEKGFVPHIINRGEKRWEQQLKDLPKPAGLLLTKDTQASVIFQRCEKFNIRVPEDLAVLGIDNHQGICLSTTPTLSSIDVNGLRIGYLAAQTLCDLINGKEAPDCQYVPPKELVARESTSPVRRLSPGIAAAVDFIHANLGEPVTMEDLVRQQELSRRSLEMTFNVELGQSPMHYLQEVRLEKVKQLLVATDLNTSSIAGQCGFRRANYLCRVFKKRYGMTPQEYRKAALARQETDGK